MVASNLYGGLSNQLFIISATIAHAKRHGYEYEIPITVTNPHKPNQLAYGFPGIVYGENHIDLAPYKEPFFHYSEIPPIDNIRLDGYWQSPKYFDEFKDELIDMFGMRVEKLLHGWCGIHVRRGDYLRFPNHHPVQPNMYYYDAMEKIYKKTGIRNFMIFSDDIEWCKQNFSMFRFEIGYRQGYDEINDLVTLASCPHIIMSNSSYSFWAQYLNPNPDKIVIAPKKERWFGKELSHHNLDDLYNEKWILV